MFTIVQDVKYALRAMVKAPGFAAVAILTIALGIGANTAIFTIVNALLIRPLPYPAPDGLVMLWQDMRARGGPADEWATPGNFVDWRAESAVLENVAAVGGWRPTLTGNAEPEALAGEQVSHEYFSVLQVAPVLGRNFASQDDVPNAPRVVIISDELWTRRFGRNPSVIGQRVTLTGDPHEIIGVLPPRVRPIVVAGAELWRPLRLNRANPSRGAVVLRVVARLADGVSDGQAQAALSTLALRLQTAHPDSNEKTGFNVERLHDRVTGQIKPGLVALAGAVGFVLLIACANIANLLTVRGSSRGRELAVRLALGAGRARMVQQLLTESLLLAAFGGIAGVIVGTWAVDALVALAPASAPRLDEISLDATVLAFTLLLTLATGLLFGLVPALQHSRVSVTHSLKDSGRGTTSAGGRRIRQGLITAEIALALMLLTGGALLIQTFVKLQSAELGFRTEGVLVGSVSPPPVAYRTPERRIAFFDQLLERVSAIPGVEQAALASVLPLAAGDSDTNFVIEGRPQPASPSDAPVTWYREVSAGYFDAIGMTIVRGRGFAPREPERSVVVNETLVRKYFPDEEPLGRRIRPGGPEAPAYTIVGVVADARVRGAREETRVETFVPYWQLSEGGMSVVLKGPNPSTYAAPLRDAVTALDRGIPIVGLRTMEEIFSESVGEPRFFAVLAGGFALLALALAAIGIYGVMAYVVSQRTAEIGVRMAVGASMTDVFRLVITDGLKLAALGVVIGLGGAVLIARSLTTLLYGVAPTDPAVLGATAALLVAVAACASIVPAWRATRVDPIIALRTE
jgi:putative ABC transport system permease protein